MRSELEQLLALHQRVLAQVRNVRGTAELSMILEHDAALRRVADALHAFLNTHAPRQSPDTRRTMIRTLAETRALVAQGRTAARCADSATRNHAAG